MPTLRTMSPTVFYRRFQPARGSLCDATTETTAARRPEVKSRKDLVIQVASARGATARLQRFGEADIRYFRIEGDLFDLNFFRSIDALDLGLQ